MTENVKVFFLKNKMYRTSNPSKIRQDCGYEVYKALKNNGVDIELDGNPDFKHLNYTGKYSIVLNWGMSDRQVKEYIEGVIYVNQPVAVSKSIDKIDTLRTIALTSPKAVAYTTEKSTAHFWFMEGHTIICRTIVNGKGGEGIVVCNAKNDEHVQEYKSLDKFPDAPLYTLYFSKTEEYRYHVIGKNVVDVQQKRRMSEEKIQELGLSYDKMIRSYSNGWVFCRDKVVANPAIGGACVKAVKALGLDFAAVDVLVKTNTDGALADYRICEVNTSPGAEGTTVDNYASNLHDYLDNLSKSTFGIPLTQSQKKKAPPSLYQKPSFFQINFDVI